MLRGTALVAVAALSFVGTTAATAYVRLSNSIDTHDTSDLIDDLTALGDDADPEDPNAGRARNLLIIGSDDRSGENAAIGGANDGMRSDTTIVAHISADRDRVDLVSIPRDSRVQIPSCTFYDGSTSQAQSALFNAAFAIGARNDDIGEAVACTANTVQSLTGIPIDGWVVVDFAGFRNMVDALGGVEMCVPNEMHSAEAGLDVLPGLQRFDGATALAWARARKGIGLGDGSDLGRLGRQQQLMGAIAQEAFAKNLLTDSAELYRFLNSTLQSITADRETGNLRNLTGLALSLQAIPPGNITFMTIPVTGNPDNLNEVIWTSAADDIWAAIANDVPMVAPTTPVEPTAPTDGSTPTDDAAPTDEPTTPTESVTPPTPGVDPFTAADLPAICGA